MPAFKAPLPMSSDKYEINTKRLALMYARDLCPLDIVEGDCFKKFVKSITLAYTVHCVLDTVTAHSTLVLLPPLIKIRFTDIMDSKNFNFCIGHGT